jgi:hypothetical protein
MPSQAPVPIPARQPPVAARLRCGSLSLALNGAPAALRCSGALWLPDVRMLVVADLHLEKGSSYAARGVMLPPSTPAPP